MADSIVNTRWSKKVLVFHENYPTELFFSTKPFMHYKIKLCYCFKIPCPFARKKRVVQVVICKNFVKKVTSKEERCNFESKCKHTHKQEGGALFHSLE